MGKVIVIEGLDGSGKGTQTNLLFNDLCSSGVLVQKKSFPEYDSQSSALIKMYLAGEFGDKPDDVNAYAASCFYAVDRYASYKSWQQFYQQGGIILADRFTTSNAIHQCAKLPQEQWDAYINWLFDFEYNKLEIPKPDLVIYLKVDPDVSQKLMTGRYSGDDSKKDIHEKDVEYLKKCRRAADYCAEKLNWTVIECCENGSMRSIEDIQAEIKIQINQLDVNKG